MGSKATLSLRFARGENVGCMVTVVDLRTNPVIKTTMCLFSRAEYSPKASIVASDLTPKMF
uniref:Uncharacterized protein n=1 Tax=Cannabis sativa TaxID=3483 RepID=A0A803RA18_CANSA